MLGVWKKLSGGLAKKHFLIASITHLESQLSHSAPPYHDSLLSSSLDLRTSIQCQHCPATFIHVVKESLEILGIPNYILFQTWIWIWWLALSNLAQFENCGNFTLQSFKVAKKIWEPQKCLALPRGAPLSQAFIIQLCEKWIILTVFKIGSQRNADNTMIGMF